MTKMKWVVLVLAALVVGGCTKKEEAAPAVEEKAAADEAKPAAPSEPLLPLPDAADVDMDKVLLGRSLYFDTALSGDGTISCASCHSLDHGGAEPRKTSTGMNGASSGRSTRRRCLNASLQPRRSSGTGGPRTCRSRPRARWRTPVEMGATWDKVVSAPRQEECRILGRLSQKLYADGVTQANVTDAIAEYEQLPADPVALRRST